MKTLALCAFILFAGCYKESITPVTTHPIDTAAVIIDTPVIVPICYEGNIITYFGNSITVGTGTTNFKNRWTALVTKRLKGIEDNRGIGGSFLEKGVPLNPLRTGPNMIDNLPNVPEKTDLLSLLVISYGINDVGYNGGTYTPENFLLAYDSVLKYITTVKKWPTSNVLLVAPNYLANLNFYVTFTNNKVPPVTEERLLSFILAVKQTSDKYHTLYASPYPIMKGRTELFPDGLHPNDSGHVVLSDIIYAAIPK